MNPKSQLLHFYFGTVDEAERLRMEQDLLTDTETLLDYLELKRTLENAEAIPSGPSPFLWSRLQSHVRPRYWYLAAAGLVAAGVIGFLILQTPQYTAAPVQEGVLFDAAREQAFSSHVL